MICIFTYERPEMLQRVIDETRKSDHEVVVFDDGSRYDEKELDLEGVEYKRYEHGGKEGYWRQWDRALKRCKKSYDDHFIFLPDDWHSFDISTVDRIHEQKNVYAFNLANKGCSRSWTPMDAFRTDINGYTCYRVGFVDCCFSTSRKTLELLDWMILPQQPSPNRSSGVGKQLSNRLYRINVAMYKPIKSLCDEDPHESLMNPHERKKNPNLPR